MIDPVGAMLRVPRPLRALSLDLDDTLLDTDAAAPARLAAAMGRAAEVLGHAVPAERGAAAVGDALAADPVTAGRLNVLFAALGLDAADPVAVAMREAYDAALLPNVRPFPGVTETLAVLRRNYRLVITTNGPVAFQGAKVRAFGLEALVDAVVISEAVGARKPEAAIFLAACRAIDVPPAETAHIGDSWVADVAGAAAAGLATIRHDTGQPRVRPPGVPDPDATVRSLRDLLGPDRGSG